MLWWVKPLLDCEVILDKELAKRKTDISVSEEDDGELIMEEVRLNRKEFDKCYREYYQGPLDVK